MKFIKISFAVLAACLTIGSLSSFTKENNSYYWHYNGDADPENFNEIGEWSGSATPETCSSGNRPCQITTATNNPSELAAVLSMHEGTELLDVAGRKP